MCFTGRWRDYQRTVLDELDSHLDDSRLHVVAAPGSGKTILGLEVLRRIARPTIVLAPTVTIREQWLDRLCQYYLNGAQQRPDWTSNSIAKPKELTVLTYQALDAALRDTEAQDKAKAAATEPSSYDCFVRSFQALGPATLVLDEAHHLRREWWRALMRLKGDLKDVRIVALTATPPYDVDPAEWRRYRALCGPMDAEISIPPLVQNGDLCPHQDLLHVSVPTQSESDMILAQREQLEAIVARLQQDQQLLDVFQAHPWLTETDKHIEEILDSPELQSAMLIFLHSAGREVPKAAVEILGVSSTELPPLTADILEVLLNDILFVRLDAFALDPKWRKQLEADLRRAGGIDRGRVLLVGAMQFYRTLAGSIAKVGSVVAIARTEAALLGDRLRMVVLADYVRADDLKRSPDELAMATRLGVVPIFEALRNADIAGVRLAVLSGPLVIVPSELLKDLEKLTEHKSGALSHHALPNSPGYAEVRFDSLGLAVETLTSLFEQGRINMLVGTQALLGEGWDAPALNSLVLASFVGSYMSSNQMRGRAIRTDPDHPDKAANIWHLATVMPVGVGGSLQPLQKLFVDGPTKSFDPSALGADMAMLVRRFQAFEGLTEDDPPLITNGVDRLGLDRCSWTEQGIADLNRSMTERAARRSTLRERWAAALGSAPTRHPRMRQVASVKRHPQLVRIDQTLQYLAISGVLSGLWAAIEALGRRALPSDLYGATLLFLGIAILYMAPKVLKAAYLFIRNGTLERSLGAVGRVLVDSLAHAGKLETPSGDIIVRVDRESNGRRVFRVLGATRKDENQILGALGEVLGPVRNPRYLLMQTSVFARHRQVDYHSVPAAYANKIAEAQRFARLWNRRVGQAKLVSLRTIDGRRILLRARGRSLAAGFQEPLERYSVWQ